MITVAEMMTTGAKTLTASACLNDVRSVMDKYSCHHVPIVDAAGRLEGLVSHRDVLRVTESTLLPGSGPSNAGDIKVTDFMTTEVFTVRPETSLRKAAIYIRTQRYGCLPVIQDKKLVGLITDSDFVNIAIDLLEQIEESEAEEQD